MEKEKLVIEAEFDGLPSKGNISEIWLIPSNWRLVIWLLNKFGAKTGIISQLTTRKIPAFFIPPQETTK